MRNIVIKDIKDNLLTLKDVNEKWIAAPTEVYKINNLTQNFSFNIGK